MTRRQSATRIASFCGKCDCGCPELLIDHDAPNEQRVVITDDFGQRIQMSIGQLEALVQDARNGKLDNLVVAGAS
jgi:hypothetical protein